MDIKGKTAKTKLSLINTPPPPTESGSIGTTIENETKSDNILTYWSVAQAGSNDEKKVGGKNLVGLSLLLKKK